MRRSALEYTALAVAFRPCLPIEFEYNEAHRTRTPCLTSLHAPRVAVRVCKVRFTSDEPRPRLCITQMDLRISIILDEIRKLDIIPASQHKHSAHARPPATGLAMPPAARAVLLRVLRQGSRGFASEPLACTSNTPLGLTTVFICALSFSSHKHAMRVRWRLLAGLLSLALFCVVFSSGYVQVI